MKSCNPKSLLMGKDEVGFEAIRNKVLELKNSTTSPYFDYMF